MSFQSEMNDTTKTAYKLSAYILLSKVPSKRPIEQCLLRSVLYENV